MVDGIEQQYDEESDLVGVIDERLVMGATAGRIQVAQATANTLTKLLIDKGIFTSEEFVAIMREKQKKFNETVESAKAKNPDSTPQELKDLERHLEVMTNGFNAICEKVSEK
jgi:polyhydroxyalkanoate synthesis regulator phasin